MNRLHALASLAGALALTLLALPAARADQPQITKPHKLEPGRRVASLKLGLSSPLGKEDAERNGAALAEALSEALGHPVQAEILPAAEIGPALAAGKIDLAWLTAIEYVNAAKAANGRIAPVAKALRAGLPFYRSVLFTTKAHKELVTPADLKGRKLALVADPSSAGYRLPHQTLLAAGLTEEQIKAQATYYRDHADVCRAVLSGSAEAGATISNDKAGAAIAGCAETAGASADQLKVLSTSDPIPNDVFALKPGATVEQFALLRAALLDLPSSQAGKALLAALHIDGFTTADDGDFDPLRAILRAP